MVWVGKNPDGRFGGYGIRRDSEFARVSVVRGRGVRDLGEVCYGLGRVYSL